MIRYKLKRLADNLITHAQERVDDIENPWAEFFADRKVFWDMYDSAEAIVDQDGNEVEPARVKNYEVIKEDMATELQLAAAQAEVERVVRAGNEIIKSVSLRNAQKQINVAQTLAFVQSFAGVVQLLQVGALETAKSVIEQIQPNELVSQEDKDFVLGLLAEAIG
jgi:hypothetical protein